MIRRSVHASRSDCFTRRSDRQHKTITAAVRYECENVYIQKIKEAVRIDDILMQIHQTQPSDINAEWEAAVWAAAGEQWPALCWPDETGQWIIMTALGRIVGASIPLKHAATMNLTAFGAWLRSQF